MAANNPCTLCGKPGIKGLISGAGKCQYHYNVGQFGQEWADKCRRELPPETPNDREALRLQIARQGPL